MKKAISAILFVVALSLLATATAQDTNSTLTPAPSLTPTVTPEPTPTMLSIGIQVLNGTDAMKNVDITIDGEYTESTGSSGEADFMLAYGAHEVEITINNETYHNPSLVVTKPEVIKIDLSDDLSAPTLNPIATPALTDSNVSDNSNSALGLVIIAITIVCVIFLFYKRRND